MLQLQLKLLTTTPVLLHWQTFHLGQIREEVNLPQVQQQTQHGLMRSLCGRSAQLLMVCDSFPEREIFPSNPQETRLSQVGMWVLATPPQTTNSTYTAPSV